MCALLSSSVLSLSSSPHTRHLSSLSSHAYIARHQVLSILHSAWSQIHPPASPVCFHHLSPSHCGWLVVRLLAGWSGPPHWPLTGVPVSSPVQIQILAEHRSTHAVAPLNIPSRPSHRTKQLETSPALESDWTCCPHLFSHIGFHTEPAICPQQPPTAPLCKDVKSSKGIQSNLMLKWWTTSS